MVFTVTPNRSPTAANAQRAAENWLSRASNEMHAWHSVAQSRQRLMQPARSALPCPQARRVRPGVPDVPGCRQMLECSDTARSRSAFIPASFSSTEAGSSRLAAIIADRSEPPRTTLISSSAMAASMAEATSSGLS